MALISKKLMEVTALFPLNTAGHDMITDIPVFEIHSKAGEVKEYILDKARNYRTLNYVYIVDGEGRLAGVLSMKELLQAKSSSSVRSIMQTDLVSVTPLDTIARVALLALKHNVKMLPIVDHKNHLLGAFGTDQILEILNKEFSNDLLRLSGVTVPKKHFSFHRWKIVSSRLPWMLVGMFGGLATGMIINAFKSSIQAIILLAVFIPVIMSTGATSANQSAMIFIRNLFHGDIHHRTRYLLNELKVSGLLGLILGSMLFLLLLIYPGDYALSFAVSLSLSLTIVAGAIIGVLTPMALNRLKLDPSIGAGPFLTIIKDLIAMSIYFAVSTLLLSLFDVIV